MLIGAADELQDGRPVTQAYFGERRPEARAQLCSTLPLYPVNLHVIVCDVTFHYSRKAMSMIVNTKYRFIFVHIPKSAGTSVSKALLNVPGSDLQVEAKTKHETLAEFEHRASMGVSFIDAVTAPRIKDYTCFCFVRNPWDRLSSFYHFLTRNHSDLIPGGKPTFRSLLHQAEQREPWITKMHSMRQQVDFITVHDRLAIDYVGHYEHLLEDFRAITQKIGLGEVRLATVNSSQNSSIDYRSNYDSEMADIVSRLFKDDIRHFHYVFEQGQPKTRISNSINCALLPA